MPLPPPPLGARPEGLLSLLGIQAGGRYPQHLAEQLLPTADLLQWYLEQEVQYAQAQLTIASAASVQLIATVPATEQWLLRDCSMADASTLPGGVTKAGARIYTALPNGNLEGVLIAQNGWVGGEHVGVYQNLGWRILNPGCTITAGAISWAGAGSPIIICTVRYVALPR